MKVRVVAIREADAPPFAPPVMPGEAPAAPLPLPLVMDIVPVSVTGAMGGMNRMTVPLDDPTQYVVSQTYDMNLK